VLQRFGDKELGFIGILHFWWVSTYNEIEYANKRETPVYINSFWDSEWLDTPEEGTSFAQKIQSEKLIDEIKLLISHQNCVKKDLKTFYKYEQGKILQAKY
jgi:hypothetical protein